MAIKRRVALTTLPGSNEQSNVSPRTLAGAGTYESRDYGELSRFARALFLLNVTAISGTLDVTIEGKDETAGIYRTIATFPQVAAVSTPTPIEVNPLYYTIVRATFVVGGATPSVTFTLEARGLTEEPVA